LNYDLYDFVFVAASVAFQQGSFSASEGGMGEVCAVINNVPTGGLECLVVATLSAANGKAGECWCFIVIMLHMLF